MQAADVTEETRHHLDPAPSPAPSLTAPVSLFRTCCSIIEPRLAPRPQAPTSLSLLLSALPERPASLACRELLHLSSWLKLDIYPSCPGRGPRLTELGVPENRELPGALPGPAYSALSVSTASPHARANFPAGLVPAAHGIFRSR